MSRKRYISTKISHDSKLARVSADAALLHAYMIPHAMDNCRLEAATIEELKYSVVPSRNWTDEHLAELIDELMAQRLVGQDIDGRFFLPAGSFYEFQTYIKPANRAETPEDDGAFQRHSPQSAAFQRKTPNIAAEQRESAESLASFSFPVSSSVSIPATAGAVSSRARAGQCLSQGDDLGLGDKHPGNIAGWEIWSKFEANCAAKGKRLPFFTIEAMGQDLIRWREGGSDPADVVRLAVRSGWLKLVDLDPRDKSPPDANDGGAALRRISAIANGSG